MIRHQAFKHGWFYHYRLHTKKLESAPSLLQGFLLDVFDNCPDELFVKGPRGSGLRLQLDFQLNKVDHHFTELAKAAHVLSDLKSAHSRVQLALLNYENTSFASEVPLWLFPHELDSYQDVFQDEGALTGHIDLLSFEDNKVWVWDYKPNALKEKFAHVQTYFYALMLSQRTGLPLNNFMCGYFDENDCFTFKPSKPELVLPELINA